jgi:hypothetical protein
VPTLIDAGETWSSPTYEVRDSAGALVSATVTATVTLPDGTVKSSPADFTVTNLATGQYAVDYLTSTTAALVGGHDVAMTATGGGLGSVVKKWSDAFTTIAPGGLLVSADDALTHLRASGVIKGAGDLDQLRWLCYLATQAVAGDLGRAVVRETVTEKHDGDVRALKLRRTPVRSITSVTENGTVLSATDGVDWTLDASPRTGLLWRGGTYAGEESTIEWACGRANITVVYVAGYSPTPAVVRHVALEAVARLWQTSQQAGHDLVDDVTADAAVFSAQMSLPGPDKAAYDNLRAGAGLGLA